MRGALLLLLLAGSFCAAPAFAHGTGAETLGGKAVAVQLFYVGGEPMPYVEAKVFSPVDAKAPFQQGRADKLGRVSFYPDTPGNWRVVAVDGEGHAVRAEVPVTAELTAPSSASTGKEEKSLRRWLFVSMLVNLALFLFGLPHLKERIAQRRASKAVA